MEVLLWLVVIKLNQTYQICDLVDFGIYPVNEAIDGGKIANIYIIVFSPLLWVGYDKSPVHHLDLLQILV